MDFQIIADVLHVPDCDKLSQAVEQEGGLIPASSSSTGTTKARSAPSSAANSTSAGCKTNPAPPTARTQQPPDVTPAQRLRTHGLVKNIGHTYKYFVTAFGKEVVATLSSSGNW